MLAQRGTGGKSGAGNPENALVRKDSLGETVRQDCKINEFNTSALINRIVQRNMTGKSGTAELHDQRQ